MTAKKIFKIVFLLAAAIAITIICNIRFPKYGNTEAEIAQIARRINWYETIVMGSDVETITVKDVENERFAIVKPKDEYDQQYAVVRFRKNQSGKYELRENGITWCSNNEIMVYRVESEGKRYDLCTYNNPNVVLLQRSDTSLVVQNLSVSANQRIALWETAGTTQSYNALTSSGVRLNQKK